MPLIALIILLQVVLVAAVDEGGLILARRLRSLLVSAASLLSAPTFGLFGSAVISAQSCAIARSTCDNVCLALDDTFSFTLVRGGRALLLHKSLCTYHSAICVARKAAGYGTHGGQEKYERVAL